MSKEEDRALITWRRNRGSSEVNAQHVRARRDILLSYFYLFCLISFLLKDNQFGRVTLIQYFIYITAIMLYSHASSESFYNYPFLTRLIIVSSLVQFIFKPFIFITYNKAKRLDVAIDAAGSVCQLISITIYILPNKAGFELSPYILTPIL